jgi:hypothetical protein
MAEREGFEPSMGDKTHTPLAGERLQPLGHLSVFDEKAKNYTIPNNYSSILIMKKQLSMECS